MANEIQATYDTGVTLYTLVFNAAGQVWRNNAPQQFLAYAPGAIGVYDIPLSEIATDTGEYRADWPIHANMVEGIYSVVLFKQAGGSPAVADDARIGETGMMVWDGGSTEITVPVAIDLITDTIMGPDNDDLKDISGQLDNVETFTAITIPAYILSDVIGADGDTLEVLSDEIAVLEARLTATRAGYLDELAAANMPADLDTIKGYTDTLEASVATILAKTNLITTGQLVITSPVSDDEEITIVQGDDYLAANGTNLAWTSEAWTSPDLTSATAKLRFVTKEDYDDGVQAFALEVDVTVTWAGSGNDAVFTADLTAAQTAALSSPTPPNDKYSYIYQLQVTTSAGKKITVALGSVYVKQEIL